MLLHFLNTFRCQYYDCIYHLENNGHFKEARYYYELMSKKFDKKKLPFISDEIEAGYLELYRYLEEN